MTNYKKIITELNRINQLMGSNLINEQAFDNILTSLIKLSKNNSLKNRITKLLQTPNLTSSDVKSLFDNIKITKGIDSSILSKINEFENSIIKKADSQKYSNSIKNGLSKGFDEDQITKDILADMRKTYGDFMNDEKILDAFTDKISKKIDDLITPKPKPKPEPGIPEENFSEIISDILPNFTKFVGDSVNDMSKIAKNVNDNVNKLKQGGLPGDQIKEIEKSILKDMQTLYYKDRGLIVSMEKEIAQGLKSEDKKIKVAFQKVKEIMDELEPITDEKLRWKSGKVAKNVSPNRWSVFTKETLKSGFSDWIYLFKLFKKTEKVQRTLKNIETLVNVDAGGVADDSIKKATQKLSGSLVLPSLKRQLYITLIGSPRGIPIKGAEKDAYEAIINAFPKQSMTAARASLVVEKIIRIIKLTITLQVLASIAQTLRNYKFYIPGTEYYKGSKRVQRNYSECINEITKKINELKKRPSEMGIDDYPKCFIDLMKSDKITDKELVYIVERAYFSIKEREFIQRVINNLDVTESTWKFIVSSRVRLGWEIYELLSDFTGGVETGELSRIDEYVEGITNEVNQLRSDIRPIEVVDEVPQEIIDSTTTTTTTTSTYTNDATSFKKYIKKEFNDDNPEISGTKDIFTYEGINFKYNNGKFE